MVRELPPGQLRNLSTIMPSLRTPEQEAALNHEINSSRYKGYIPALKIAQGDPNILKHPEFKGVETVGCGEGYHS